MIYRLCTWLRRTVDRTKTIILAHARHLIAQRAVQCLFTVPSCVYRYTQNRTVDSYYDHHRHVDCCRQSQSIHTIGMFSAFLAACQLNVCLSTEPAVACINIGYKYTPELSPPRISVSVCQLVGQYGNCASVSECLIAEPGKGPEISHSQAWLDLAVGTRFYWTGSIRLGSLSGWVGINELIKFALTTEEEEEEEVGTRSR